MIWICNGVEFKVGDKVRVMRKEETGAPNGMGKGVQWQNSWVGDDGDGWLAMDAYIGLECEIEAIDETGATFVVPDGCVSYAFPLTSLEKVV